MCARQGGYIVTQDNYDWCMIGGIAATAVRFVDGRASRTLTRMEGKDPVALRQQTAAILGPPASEAVELGRRAWYWSRDGLSFRVGAYEAGATMEIALLPENPFLEP